MKQDARFSEVVRKLESLSDKRIIEGMKQVGIKTPKAIGVSAPNLRRIAKETGKDPCSRSDIVGVRYS
ncbi:MAG TPA: hypothetical protein VJ249_12205 [Candidatus Bathyarchaeia archaeon]|nr:hypothetical protein [Candidatus Bathyarchaeia archaeon]